MSWWPVPDSEHDLTGDGPADAIEGALLDLARSREAAGQPKPSLPELMRAIELAVGAHRDRIADAPETIHVSNRDGLRAEADAPRDLVDAVTAAVEGVAAKFERGQERLPRLAEVLYTFTFTLGVPESILRPPIPDRIKLTLA